MNAARWTLRSISGRPQGTPCSRTSLARASELGNSSGTCSKLNARRMGMDALASEIDVQAFRFAGELAQCRAGCIRRETLVARQIRWKFNAGNKKARWPLGHRASLGVSEKQNAAISLDRFAPIQRLRPRPRILRLVQPITGPDEVVGGGKIVGGVRNNTAPSIVSRPPFQRTHEPHL
jgi:hypothetical protein